jgi:predicted dehydrogenase
MKKYNVVIIGGGSIGAIKSEEIDSPQTENIFTQAHAFYNNIRTNLVGIVDTNIEIAAKAFGKWKCNTYKDIKNIKDDIDIISICVPTKYHFTCVYNIIEDLEKENKLPKLIVMEKPFTDELYKAHWIDRTCKNLNIPIAVDYIRRYAPGIKQLKQDLDSNKYGKIYYTRLLLSGDIIRDGCHFLDLCRYFFGEYKSGKINGKISFDKCENIFIQQLKNNRKYSIFDIEVYTEKGKIHLCENGLYLDFYNLEKSQYGNWFQIANKKEKRIETKLNKALYHLTENAVNFLDEKENLICIAEDAIAVHKIYKELEI